jgi:hypothetical protein
MSENKAFEYYIEIIESENYNEISKAYTDFLKFLISEIKRNKGKKISKQEWDECRKIHNDFLVLLNKSAVKKTINKLTDKGKRNKN